MEQKKYLNESNYEKTKRLLVFVAIIILLIGIGTGGFLINTGIKKSALAEENTQNVRTEEVIQTELNDLKSQLASLNAKKTEEFTKNGFSEQYYTLQNEIDSIQQKVNTLTMELWEINSDYSSSNAIITKSRSMKYYMFGAFVIIASCLISGSLFLYSKRRELLAFNVQQAMPIVKEGIDEITPTISKTIKEVSKAVKDFED